MDAIDDKDEFVRMSEQAEILLALTYMSRIVKIVLTGGPCSGKTSSLPFLTTLLKAKGWKVFTIPETATLLSNNGISLVSPTLEERLITQTHILKLQITLEDAMMAAAKASKQNCIIICDRGIMDAKAYTPPDVWPKYLADNGWNEVELREGRYDAVFHLVSSAVGAPEFYNNDNPARFENLKEAVPADKRTQDAWVGHPHLRIIDNSTNFPSKISRLCAAIENFIALDYKEIERRFLVKHEEITTIKQLSSRVTLDVTQSYLQTTDGTVTRIRRRGLADSKEAIYTYTVKFPKVGTTCTEIERRITSAEYDTLWQQHDTTRRTIFKRRHCFIWGNKQFELDEFVNPETGLLILEIELDSENEGFDLPPFLTIEKEITTDPAYSNWNLAKI